MHWIAPIEKDADNSVLEKRLCATTDQSSPNPDAQRRSIITKGTSDVVDDTTVEIAIGSNPALMKRFPEEGHECGWSPSNKSMKR